MTSPQQHSMSQKPPYSLSVAMASQQPAFADTVPNMIPRAAATPRKLASNHVPFFPNLEIKHQGSYPDMSSLVSRPPSNLYTVLGSHLKISPHRPGLALSPVVYINTSRLGSGSTAVNLASYKSNAQAASLPVLPRQMQGIPSVGQTIQTAPSPSKPIGKTISRLPSNDVSRKAPLQGNSHTGKSLSQSISRKCPKPKQQQPTSQKETPIRATESVHKGRHSPNDGRQGTLVHPLIVLPETSEGKKRARNDHDEESQELEIVHVRKANDDEEESRIKTIEASSDNTCGQEEKIVRASRPRRRPTKKRGAEAMEPTPPGYHQGRRPLYEYEVPLEMEGICQALGSNNWSEYLFLLESLWLQKMTAHEFEQGIKPLFHIENDGIRKKMNSMVVKKMIMPRLEQIRSNLYQGPD